MHESSFFIFTVKESRDLQTFPSKQLLSLPFWKKLSRPKKPHWNLSRSFRDDNVTDQCVFGPDEKDIASLVKAAQIAKQDRRHKQLLWSHQCPKFIWQTPVIFPVKHNKKE